MKFPLMLVYKDPKKSWNNIATKYLLKEIEKEGFDNFTIIDEKAARMFFEFKVIKKKAKKVKKKKRVTRSE